MIDIILRATLTAAVAQGTPLLLTALGEIMNQRAGVLNLGLDGMMLFGAVTAFISLIASGSLFVAVLVGGVCAALLALIHAFLSITCRVHQVICGLALNIFAAGFSAFVGKDYNGIAAPKVLKTSASRCWRTFHISARSSSTRICWSIFRMLLSLS